MGWAAGLLLVVVGLVATTPPAVAARTAGAAVERRVLQVGPGERYATPCQAFAVARTGDRITIDAAGNDDYRGDVCTISSDRLRIVGIGGRPHIRAAGQDSQGKATWVVAGDDTTIVNVSMSGSRVPDDNGAAIRQEGTDLTLRRVRFHHNQMGILAGDNPQSDIRIVRSRFDHNGRGDGYSHNIYVNRVRSFTMTHSWSTLARVGHLVKSRAARNVLRYNRLVSGGGNSSYEVDLPNGGLSVLVGNAIEQGALSENSSLVAFGEEGDLHPDSRLYVVGNTLVNDRDSGTAVLLGSEVTDRVEVRNNVVVDFQSLVSTSAVARGNCLTTRPRFADRDRFDYWLRPASPCRDVTTTRPGSVGGLSLVPRRHYVHPTGLAPRTDRGRVAGAFGTPRPH